MSTSAEDGFSSLEINAARAGDAEMLGRALQSCRDDLLSMASRRLGHDLAAKGDASDIVQETMLGACRDFRAFRGRTRAEFRAWLRQILQNNLADFRRRYRGTEKRRVGLEVPIAQPGPDGPRGIMPEDPATPSGIAARREQLSALFAALGRLREDYRCVLIWHQYDRLTFNEIGERLGRSPEAARKLWTRALMRLTQELGSAR